MFVDCAHCLAGNPAQLHYGACVTDLDGDGVFEIVIAGFGCPTQVLKWDGAALFDIAEAVIADPESRSIGIAAGDIDGDGLEELYVLNSDTFSGPKRHGDRLFGWVGGRYLDLFDLPTNRCLRNEIAGRSVAVMDRTGAGRYGFVVGNHGGALRIYESDGMGGFGDSAADAGLDVVTCGRGLVTAPLFGGATDLFVTAENGSNLLFRNDGRGRFEEVAERVGIGDRHAHGRGVTTFDPPEGGLPGIVYANWERAGRLLHRDCHGRFEDRAPPEFRQLIRARTVVAADFDNDGYQEIFINTMGQPNLLFAWRQGAWTAVSAGAATEPRGLGTGAAVADIDGDGMLELLIAHGEAGAQPLTLYRARSNENNWIRVCVASPSGAPARGAVVHCLSGSRRQGRVIDGGSGYLCQMEPVAHFGLGAVDRVDRIDIVWPGGERTAIENPAINSVHYVAYPETTTGTGPGASVSDPRQTG